MIRKAKKKINDFEKKLILDWWIYGFLIIFLIIVICLHLNELHSTILAIFLVVCIYGIYYCKDKSKKEKYQKIEIEEIDKITKSKLIELLTTYYESLKYEVEIARNIKNYELALIIKKNDRTYRVIGNRSQIQIKKEMIQQVINFKRIYNTESFVLVSNNYYTSEAWELAKKNHIYLIDRNKLIDIYYQITNMRNQERK